MIMTTMHRCTCVEELNVAHFRARSVAGVCALLLRHTQSHLLTTGQDRGPHPQGPSVSIDTACSSSLVTTHFAFTAVMSSDCVAGLSAGALEPAMRPDVVIDI